MLTQWGYYHMAVLKSGLDDDKGIKVLQKCVSTFCFVFAFVFCMCVCSALQEIKHHVLQNSNCKKKEKKKLYIIISPAVLMI